MRNVKKIIFFIPTLAGGGAERVVSELSLNMPADIRQTIVLFERRIEYPHKADIVDLGLSAASSRSLILKPAELFMRAVRFRKVINDIRPDAVISFLQANAINALVGSFFSKKRYRIILSERTATMKIDRITEGLYGAANRALIRALYGKADRIIAVSEAIKDGLAEHFGVSREKIEVIYNPVDTDKLAALSAEGVDHEWFREGAPIISTVGRLSLQKNHKDLLKAFSILRKDLDARLVIIGEGDLKKELTELSGALGIGRDVLFLGHQKNPFKYVARSAIFALPSLFEGFPNALVEAMAVGCPVIASDCVSGPAEILTPSAAAGKDEYGLTEGKYGMLFPAGDAAALARGLKRLLSDKDLKARYASAGSKRAADFNTPRIVNRYLNAMVN